jgi:predicted Zn-dependent peptidase
VWVNVGSRHETEKQAGSAHYLEHLLFKGTQRRSALDISSAIDAVGGEMNAFTSKEHTCFYARVLDRDLPLATDVISDVVTNATLRAADIDAERTVVLEEIGMRDDDPGDVAHEELFAQMYGAAHPMGRSILGTRQTIESITPAVIRSFYNRNYVPTELVVAAAGNLKHADVVRQVRRAFTGEAPTKHVKRAGSPMRVDKGSVTRLQRPTEQVNIVMGFPGLTLMDDRKWVLAVLNSALGGGMSSRLFTEVRERRGLVYSVYSFVSSFTDSGMVGVYAGTSPTRTDAVLEVVTDVLASVAADGITAAEMERAKGQVRGSLVLGLEDTFSRMSRLGRTELTGRPMQSVAQVLDKIDAVTSAAVQSLAQEVLAQAPTTVVVGPQAAPRKRTRA